MFLFIELLKWGSGAAAEDSRVEIRTSNGLNRTSNASSRLEFFNETFIFPFNTSTITPGDVGVSFYRAGCADPFLLLECERLPNEIMLLEEEELHLRIGIVDIVTRSDSNQKRNAIDSMSKKVQFLTQAIESTLKILAD
jgi:hypothetical protein